MSTRKQRRKFSSGFKSKVALSAIKEEETLRSLSLKYQVHSNQILKWKKEFIANSSLAFSKKNDFKDLEIKYPFKGVLQMQDFLRGKGFCVNQKRVRRLMRKMNIQAIYPKRNLSKLGSEKYKKPYLLRNLKIEKANQVWAIDISYVPMEKGFMYLTVVVDWYSRYILGWQLSNTLEAVNQTEIMKKLVRNYGKPEIVNSDQGSQYVIHLQKLD